MVSARQRSSYTAWSVMSSAARSSDTPRAAWMYFRQSCSTVSIPRPNKSILTRPAASRSSRSHWMTVRPGIEAGSIGTTVRSGSRVSTNPPTWMERCRGIWWSPSTMSGSTLTLGSFGSRPVSSGGESGMGNGEWGIDGVPSGLWPLASGLASGLWPLASDLRSFSAVHSSGFFLGSSGTAGRSDCGSRS